jgi:hypothetical protein
MFTSDFEAIKASGIWELKSEEPYFSYESCEGCFDGLGGNRYDIEFKYHHKAKESYTISICPDCLDNIANH